MASIHMDNNMMGSSVTMMGIKDLFRKLLKWSLK